MNAQERKAAFSNFMATVKAARKDSITNPVKPPDAPKYRPILKKEDAK